MLPLKTFAATVVVVVVELFLHEKKVANSAKKITRSKILFFLIHIKISNEVLSQSQILLTKKRNFKENILGCPINSAQNNGF